MPVSKTQMANFQAGNMNLIVYLFKKVGSVGPGISEKMLLASISTHLHLSKGIFSINQSIIMIVAVIFVLSDAAIGQKENLELIEKNPAAFINPHQPLMTNITGKVKREKTPTNSIGRYTRRVVDTDDPLLRNRTEIILLDKNKNSCSDPNKYLAMGFESGCNK